MDDEEVREGEAARGWWGIYNFPFVLGGGESGLCVNSENLFSIPQPQLLGLVALGRVGDQ